MCTQAGMSATQRTIWINIQVTEANHENLHLKPTHFDMPAPFCGVTEVNVKFEFKSCHRISVNDV